MSAPDRKVAAASLTAVAICIALLWGQGLGKRTVRFVSGQHLVGGPLPGRSHENLPTVSVESGNRLCCRMLYCDFRFPLPTKTKLARIESVTGGFDTIRGVICVTNTDGGIVDLRAYARAMRSDGFKIGGDSSGFSASSPDGGFVAAEGLDRCRITFSFFGDY